MTLVVLVWGLSIPYSPVKSQTPDPARDLLNQLTLEQKVGQMFMVSLYGTALNYADRDLLEYYQPGGVVLFTSNISTPEQITALTNSYQQTMRDVGGLPLFIATDQEGGLIQRLRLGFTEWPPMSLLTASGDRTLAEQVGAALAGELEAVGINMNLAPVADLDTNIANPIIGRRSPGSNLDLLAETLPGFIRGSQSVGVLATVKHFPGHGDTSEDSHLILPRVDDDLDFLMARELQPFIYAIDGNVAVVMVAHIWFSALDAEPLPASLSSNVITDVLRGELGYDKLIMTDAMDMDAIDTRYAPDEAAIRAINAGVDLLTYGPGAGPAMIATAIDGVINAVRNGEIRASRIDESVYRILSAKVDYGLSDWTPLDPEGADARINLAGTVPLVEAMFRAGVTVAFDHADLLPVAADQRVGIIYPSARAEIGVSCGVLHESIYWLPLPDYPDAGDIQEAEILASQVDTVIVFTRNISDSATYQALVNRLPLERTVAVALRSPYDALTYPDVSAYVVAYGPQDPAIPTACGILFGTIESMGTLSVNLALNDG